MLYLTWAAFATFEWFQHSESRNDLGLSCFPDLPCFSSTNHDCRAGQERREKAALYRLVDADYMSSSMGRSFSGWVCSLLKGIILLFMGTILTFSFLVCLQRQLLPNIQVAAFNGMLHDSSLRTPAYFQQFSTLTLLPSLVPVLNHSFWGWMRNKL